jgi:hypothetical protein
VADTVWSLPLEVALGLAHRLRRYKVVEMESPLHVGDILIRLALGLSRDCVVTRTHGSVETARYAILVVLESGLDAQPGSSADWDRSIVFFELLSLLQGLAKVELHK